MFSTYVVWACDVASPGYETGGAVRVVHERHLAEARAVAAVRHLDTVCTSRVTMVRPSCSHRITIK